MSERHDNERTKIEQDEQNAQYQWEAFKPDATDRVSECFENDGDLVDLINTLDLEYDELESLSNKQINEIVLDGTFKSHDNQEKLLENIDGEVLHEYLRASGYIFNKA